MDPRREALSKLLGDELLADGAAIRLWRVAQEYWKRGSEPIPNHVFEHVRYRSELVKCGLAVSNESGTYVRGSSKQFEWIDKLRTNASKAGKKSAEKRRLVNGTAQPLSNQTRTTLEHARTESNDIERSSSSSSSSSLSLSNSLSLKKKRSAGALPPLALIWNEFCGPDLSKVQEVNPVGKRGKACNARWNEKPDREYWVGVMQKMISTPFCMGINQRGWKANFEFLCKPDSAASVLEGKYENKQRTLKTSLQEHNDAFFEQAFKQLDEQEMIENMGGVL